MIESLKDFYIFDTLTRDGVRSAAESERLEWLFFSAWRDAMHYVGPEVFGYSAEQVDAAQGKNDLRPAITLAFERCPSNRRILMITACSMFSISNTREELRRWSEAAPLGYDFATLDYEGKIIAARLMLHYPGW